MRRIAEIVYDPDRETDPAVLGFPIRIELFECDTCGVTVSDPDKHRDWHDSIGAPVPSYTIY